MFERIIRIVSFARRELRIRWPFSRCALTFVTLRVLVLKYGEFVNFAELLEQRPEVLLLQVIRNAANEQLRRAPRMRETAAGRLRAVRDAQRRESRLHWIEGIHHFFRHFVARTNTHQTEMISAIIFTQYKHGHTESAAEDDLKQTDTHQQVTGCVPILIFSSSERQRAADDGIKKLLPKLSRRFPEPQLVGPEFRPAARRW